MGITQEQRDFGLPVEDEDYGWSDDSWGAAWWNSSSWGAEDYDMTANGGVDLRAEDVFDGSADDQGVPEQDEHNGAAVPSTTAPVGATGSSPSHRAEVPMLGSRTMANLDGSSATGSPAKSPTLAPVDELSIADSFIMEVLRGWRLLQAAGLNAEEKRDILSTTKNSLDYETIAAALQNLWDDQLLGQRYSGNASYQSFAVYQDDPEDYADPLSEWWGHDDGWWDAAYFDEYSDDAAWWPETSPQELQTIAESATSPAEEERLREAQHAEKVAESLAMQAQRTWSEAQRATQALRKDRGFGQYGSSSNQVKCYLCGGSHFARDCPDQGHPTLAKARASISPSSGRWTTTLPTT